MRPSHAAAGLALAFALAVQAAPASAQVRELPPAVAGAILADPDTPVAGAAAGDVTVVEYFDYNCPFCKKMHPEIAALLKADPKARVLYKQWPVLGPTSVYAAQVALAARWQGRHVAVHDAFMNWKPRLDGRDTVRRLAKDAGVDLARLDRDLAAHADEIARILDRSDEEARLLRLQGTPALVVGRVLVPGGLPGAMLQRLVAQERHDTHAAGR